MTPRGHRGITCLSILFVSIGTQISMPDAFAQDYYQPDYVAAISDLDAARAVIANKQSCDVTAGEKKALSEINTAMAELCQLAKACGENDPPEKLFPNFDPSERYTEALDLLDKAHLSVYQRNCSDPVNQILGHIDTAIGILTSQST